MRVCVCVCAHTHIHVCISRYLYICVFACVQVYFFVYGWVAGPYRYIHTSESARQILLA